MAVSMLWLGDPGCSSVLNMACISTGRLCARVERFCQFGHSIQVRKKTSVGSTKLIQFGFQQSSRALTQGCQVRYKLIFYSVIIQKNAVYHLFAGVELYHQCMQFKDLDSGPLELMEVITTSGVCPWWSCKDNARIIASMLVKCVGQPVKRRRKYLESWFILYCQRLPFLYGLFIYLSKVVALLLEDGNGMSAPLSLRNYNKIL